jgi:hypothetical protein
MTLRKDVANDLFNEMVSIEVRRGDLIALSELVTQGLLMIQQNVANGLQPFHTNSEIPEDVQMPLVERALDLAGKINDFSSKELNFAGESINRRVAN